MQILLPHAVVQSMKEKTVEKEALKAKLQMSLV
jgi:hypothetical protein